MRVYETAARRAGQGRLNDMNWSVRPYLRRQCEGDITNATGARET